MSVRRKRCLLLGGVLMLASGLPVMAQSPGDPGQERSSNDHYGNQSTNREYDSRQSGSNEYRSNDSQYQSNEYRSDADRQAQNRSDQSNDRFGRDDRQERRDDRQDGRWASRQSQRDQNQRPAIGVTVIERGGMGVRVVRVLPQSPAAQAGIEPGDTILEVDGRRVGTPQQLIAAIESNQAGETAELAVLSDGRERSVPVRLSTRQQALPPQLRDQDFSDARRFSFDRSRQFSDDGRENWRQDEQGWGQGQPRFRDESYGQYDNQQNNFGPPPPPAEAYGRSADRGQYENQRGFNQGVVRTDYQDEQRFSNDRQWQLGERLAQRLDTLESRIDRLTDTLEELRNNRDGSTSSSESSQQNASSPSGSQNSDASSQNSSDATNQQQ
jgi:hypothetical protein